MTGGAPSSGRVTCLVCNATQATVVAQAAGQCSICGSAEWDPPLDRPIEVDSGGTQVHSVPQPLQPEVAYLPTAKRKFPVKLLVIIAVVVALVLGIRALWPSVSPQAQPSTSSSAVPFKKGDWLLVLASLPKKTKSQDDARAVASQLNKKSATKVLDGAAVPSLMDEYWYVVAKTAFKSRSAATKACDKFGRKAGDECNPRQVM